MYKRITALLTAALILSVLAMPCTAHEIPDLQRTGTLRLQMTFEGKPLDGGSLTLFRVGKISLSDGNAVFALVDALPDGSDLSDLDDPELADLLADMAWEYNLPALEAPIKNGWAVFSSLECGLYVVTQQSTQATSGFDAIQPFLIALPQWLEGKYVYNLNASPKVPLVPEDTSPSTPATPTTPTTPGTPQLPQTGQLNWPIPVLAVLGMTFFVAGWSLSYGRKCREK